MKRVVFCLVGLLMLVGSPVWAQQTADQILKTVDDRASSFTDMKMKLVFTTRGAEGASKTITALAYQKGSKRLYHFVETGLAFLSLDSDNSYVYMPEERKVRRIAAHSTNQTFMGTDYNASDMSVVRYDDFYTPKLLETTANDWQLELTPKAGKNVAYSKVRIRIDNKLWVITRLDYFNKKGELEKTELRSDWIKAGSSYFPRAIDITNVKTKHKTTASSPEVLINTGLSDEMFTQRYLKRLEQ
jgi:outer membrane lipoprotein-sorting protein